MCFSLLNQCFILNRPYERTHAYKPGMGPRNTSRQPGGRWKTLCLQVADCPHGRGKSQQLHLRKDGQNFLMMWSSPSHLEGGIWVFPKIEVPQNGWEKWKTLLKWMILGTSIFGNTHIIAYTRWWFHINGGFIGVL